MSTQIFKSKIDDNVLFEMLDKICLKNENYYILNKDSFKKGIYNEYIQHFLISCMPYYHLSKRKYLEKKTSYNTFITVIRQICNYNKITYKSQIKYEKSTYDIVYYIYY